MVIGGVYLDGTLAPINVDQLDGVTEYSDLEPLEWTCGGTAHYVARYLKEYRNTRSYLFTRIGDDSLSGELKRKLKVEGKIESTKGEQCGVSIHLRRRIDIAKVDTAKVDTEKVDTKKAETENGNSDWRWTTFTHKGALANLTWPSVMPQLQRKTESPSLLYISSYFRTSLWQNLTDSLQKISPRAVVCVSHGRYAKGENPAAVNELIRAFQEGQVDIYICTLRELKRLIEDSGRTIPYVTTRKFLKALAVEKLLPRITVVRPIGNDATTYYMIDRSVRKETARGREANRPGLNGAFSAGLIYGLCRAVEGQGIEGTAERAVRLAIDDYCNAASEAS